MANKILVLGGSGLVGSKFISLHNNAFEISAPSTDKTDILSKEQIAKSIEEFNPETVINFAAYTNVEQAEEQKGDKEGICFKVNALGAKNVAEVCKNFDKHLVHISTEYVFDGTKESTPYTEEDKPNPINWYGQTKFFAEEYVLQSGCKTIIARLSMPYTPLYEQKKDIARFFLEQLKNGKEVTAVEDQRITPTIVSDIANGLKTLLEEVATGIYHISSTDSISPLEFAKTIAETFQLDYSLISPTTLEEYNKNKKAKLLKNSTLNPAKFEREFGEGILHTVEQGLIIFKEEIDEMAAS